jgi:MFS family permease
VGGENLRELDRDANARLRPEFCPTIDSHAAPFQRARRRHWSGHCAIGGLSLRSCSWLASARLDRNTAFAVITAGLIWGLYNVGFAMIFSFGPSMLVERGWSMSAAGSTISIVLWLAVVSVPLGGFLADRSGRPAVTVVGGCIVFAMLMVALPRSNEVIPIVIALGMISGQPAGPILSLPARALKPETRAIGMGIFTLSIMGR